MRRRTSLSTALAVAVGLATFSSAGQASDKAVPVSEKPPSIGGTMVEGNVLGADRGHWRSNSGTVYGHQWRRCAGDGTGCADIPSATDRIYALVTADVGHVLRLVVTATNRDGSAAATSDATPTITALSAAAPHNTGPPVVSGSTVVGRVVVASSGTWTGTGPFAFAYRWRRCSATGGDCDEISARSRAYKLSSDDVNRTVRVLVIARGSSGIAASLSVPSTRVAKAPAPAAPQNRSLPRIQGLAQQGQQLRGDRGVWTNLPSSYAYTWLRCDRNGNGCDVIPGARGGTYSVGSADVGHTIRLEIDAKNPGGTVRAFSAPSAVVLAQPPAAALAKPSNTSIPKIAGTAQEGRTLVGDRGTWSNAPTKYEYSWRRCSPHGDNCDGIGGANGTSYVLRGDDVGKTIRFRVRAINSSGSDKANSSPTAVVRASAKPANSAPPTISGTPAQGSTLSAGNGSWTHGPSDYGYAWQRCDRNGNFCASIPAARQTTYVLGSADVGNTLRLRVVASNSEGSTAATSAPTAVIQKAAAPPPPPPSRGSGCPAAAGSADQVTAITSPARLLVDTLQSDPRVVSRGTGVLVVRFHVTSTCGRPVAGALVYATATPYNQFAIPPETPTGPDGWATLVFRRLRGFPVSGRQQLIAMFVRARKPGESLLGGISTRRLVAIPVRLG